MSNREEDPAFPTFGPRENSGMSLRDYFAAQVIPFVLTQEPRGYEARCAARAYAVADAMLAERSK